MASVWRPAKRDLLSELTQDSRPGLSYVAPLGLSAREMFPIQTQCRREKQVPRPPSGWQGFLDLADRSVRPT